VRGTLARIKCLLAEGVPPDEIALVARDDAFYGPIVSAIAWEYGLPVRTLYAVPLSETRLGAWFELLLEVIFSDLPFEATARTVQGHETLPSPYLARLGVAEVDAALQTIVASPEELRRVLIRQPSEADDPVLSHARHALAVERERESTNCHDEYDGVTGVPLDAYKHVWSVSQLTALGQCPFGWFSQFALKLAEAEEAEDSLSAADRGNLYHKVLEAALKVAVRRTENPNAGVIREFVLGELDSAFRRVEKEMGLTLLPAWDAQRGEHLAVLRRAVAGADFIKDDAVVVASEQKFEGEWQGLKVRGAVDRIDRTPGGLVLVDYKSGASISPGPKDSEGKTRLDIQLPLYTHVVSASLFNGEQVADAYYYSPSKSRVIKRSLGGDPAPTSDFVGRIKAYLQEGRFPVEPDAERTACEYCDYDLVCRKGARVERIRALAGNPRRRIPRHERRSGRAARTADDGSCHYHHRR
jgi:hypothetical protein